MKFFAPEGTTCSWTDAKDFVDKLTDAFSPTPDASKIRALGTLAISFEGAKQEVGFFHRYDVSCSAIIGQSSPGSSTGLKSKGGLKDVDSCKTCKDALKDALKAALKANAKACGTCEDDPMPFIDEILSNPALQDIRVSHGVVKLDWVRIGLVGAIILGGILFVFLLISMMRRPSAY